MGIGPLKEMGVLGTVGSEKSRAMESANRDPNVSELKARVVAMESQLAQITQLLMSM